MFSKNSRYKELKDLILSHGNFPERKSKVFRRIPETKGVLKHRITESDRLDLLAFKYYDDSQKWWKICDANPEYMYPSSLLNDEPFILIDMYLDKKSKLSKLSLVVNKLLKSKGIRKVTVNQFEKAKSYFEVNAEGYKTQKITYQPKIQVVYNENETDNEIIEKILKSEEIIVSEKFRITPMGREINIPAK